MKSTKIFEICNMLSKEEFLKFEIFLEHFSQAGEKTVELYAFLKEAYIRANHKWHKAAIDKEEIKPILYNQKNADSSFRMLCNDLRKHLEKYCSFLQMQEEKHHFLLRFLVERNDEQYFWKVFRKTNKDLEPYEGITKLHTQYELWNNSKAIEFIKSPIKRKTNFDEFYYSFSNYAVVKKMQQYCVLLNRKIISDDPIPEKIDEDINRDIKWVLQQEELILITQFYVWCIEMLRGNKESYLKLKSSLVENINRNKKEGSIIQKEDLKWLFHYLYTFCIWKYPEDTVYYQLEMIEIYFHRFDKDLLQTGNFISAMHVKNICNYAMMRTQMDNHLTLSQDEYYKIIQATSKKVNPVNSKSIRNHNLGVYYFYFKEFDKAVEIIRKQKLAEYPNTYFRFDDQTILLRSLYELLDDDSLEKAMRNFKSILDHDKLLPVSPKKEYANFILAMRKLYLTRLNIVEVAHAQKLLKELNKLLARPIKVGHWFVEKREALQFLVSDEREDERI